MNDENELTYEDDDDPLNRLEASEARCNAVESVLALIAVALTRIDAKARGQIIDQLEMIERASRKQNLHDEGIQALRRVHHLLVEAPGS